MKEFFCSREYLGYSLDIYIKEFDRVSHVHDMVASDIEPGRMPSNKTMTLHEQEAQVLIDQLWQAGLRPSNGEGSVGQIGAVKEHCDDLRKIAFKCLKIEEK